MSEVEWRDEVLLNPLFHAVLPSASTRKLRLFACGSCDILRPLFSDRAVSDCLQAAQAWADDRISRAELYAARRAANWDNRNRHLEVGLSGLQVAESAVDLATRPRRDTAGKAAWFALYASRESGLVSRRADGRNGWCDEEQANLLRDIFGNPFRPVAFSTLWRTDTAVSLAQGMYESRDFGAMPILADALQDAGCDTDDILTHCRDPKRVHVCVCWVVDLVLGKA